MRNALFYPVLLFCTIAVQDAARAQAASESGVQPLFPVKMEHEFPAAKETFEEVRQLILENYYTPEITEEALYWAAIEGMLRYLSPRDNPELSKIWTAAEYERILQSLEGVDISLGLKSSFNANDGSLTVNEVLPNSAAEGIVLPYDRILKIDNQVLKGKSVADINTLMNGPPDSDVILTINREVQIFDIRLTRVKFETQNLFVYQLSPKAALVELRYFSQGISDKLQEELSKLRDNGTEAVILDLRNNSGGVFGEALKVCHQLVPERGIVLRTYNQQEKLKNYASGNAEPFDFRLAVLTNSGTASASEIVVGALRDQRKAFVIGSKTFGKGVFERTFTLENEFRVKFITGAMYTPTGVAWQGKGIAPDFLVEQDTATVTALQKADINVRLSRDIALITALKLLNLSISNTP